MIEIPEANAADFWMIGSAPLWRGVRVMTGARSANVKCVNGHIAGLTAHTIAADGTVSPSLVCPEEGCDWHVMAKLAGWKP